MYGFLRRALVENFDLPFPGLVHDEVLDANAYIIGLLGSHAGILS
jgi:hypothetical protein